MSEQEQARVYLGDGVYAIRSDCGDVILVTHDGERETNRIYLDSDVLESFIEWAQRK